MPKLQTLRLQFSLRFALAAMMLVSVALVVYRWPWTVVVDKPGESRTTTRYRRNWHGKSVKDGLELQEVQQGSTMERWYSDGDLRLERALSEGVAYLERHYQGGKMHGPCWNVAPNVRVDGQYYQGQLDGEWRWTSADVVTREEWQQGQRHGRKTWTTPAGRLLQSADYKQGRLVQWNDRPVAAELHRWLEAEVSDDRVRERMLQPLRNSTDAFCLPTFHSEVFFFRGLSIHWEKSRPDSFGSTDPPLIQPIGEPLGVEILAQALETSQTFTCRFNSIYVVPITAVSLDWQDRTGVSNVQFEPGSQQALVWLLPAAASRSAEHPADRFQKMFAPTSETGITLDTSAIKKPVPEPTDGFLLEGGSYPGPRNYLPRRDLFGKHLDMEGCYCEQQGNTLIIKRLD